MRARSIVIFAVAFVMMGGIAACGDDSLDCGEKDNGVIISCNDDSSNRTVATTTTQRRPTASTTTPKSSTTTVTVSTTSVAAATKTVTVLPPPTATVTRPTATTQPAMPAFVSASSEQASCNSQGVYEGDVDAKLFSVTATFYPGSNLERAGFEFSGDPDFPIVNILVNTPDAPDQFHGYPLNISNQQIGTGAGQHLAFFLNNGYPVKGFVFCAQRPFAASW